MSLIDYSSSIPTTNSTLSIDTIYSSIGASSRSMNDIRSKLGWSGSISFSQIISGNLNRYNTQVLIQENTPLILYTDVNCGGSTVARINNNSKDFRMNIVGQYTISVTPDNAVSSLKVPPYTSVTLWEHTGTGMSVTYNGFTHSSQNGGNALTSSSYNIINWVGNDFNDRCSSFVLNYYPQRYGA